MRSRRWAGLALLVLYVMGGAWGLPVLDAVVYHSTDAGRPAGPHVEPFGGCGHADGCTLGIRTPPSSPPVVDVPVERDAPPLGPAPLVTPASVPHSPLRQSQRPRAPPVQLS